MTEWRDARLQKALDHAPDADARPSDSARREILARARQAVAPPPAKPWWKQLWPDSGGARMPWNAALATVVVATLVTVIWHDREVPDAKPESAQVDRPAPRGAGTRLPETLPAPAATPGGTAAGPAVPSAPAPVETAPAARKAAPVPPKPAPAPAPTQAPAPQPPQTQAPQAQAPMPAPVVPAPGVEAARERAGGELAKSAAQDNARAERADAMPKRATAPAPAAAPAPAPAAMPAPAAPAPPSAAAQAPVRSPAFEAQGRAGASQSAARAPVGLQRGARPESGATQLRISGMDRRVEVPLDRPSRLADQLGVAIAAANSALPLDTPPSSRVELLRDGESLGTLELAGPQVRWTPAGGAPRTGRPDEALLQALREELERRLSR